MATRLITVSAPAQDTSRDGVAIVGPALGWGVQIEQAEIKEVAPLG